ncbi:hypothetical protein ARHIZOSPH14_01420 [Agromyces rhizosphaerae]|uniref:DUF1929 domain-containing protein n=1 Tax=Agromyces rhizosphaerae TaxID=88374 RepID=A0A9W6CT39_9MICO|nr:galactose oxidase early set domain-containing protein [Agromyces rhizosphaerae]GLI25900.1 hypothetical protein ARHIZOSPH14_01420 [Agromyces rhizosphaerae]
MGNLPSPVFRALAALAAIAVLATIPAATVAAPANLVQNPSLEDGEAWPTCFAASGWGTEADWSFVERADGGRAVRIDLAGHEAGDRKLLQAETDACAPAVEPGNAYDLEVAYRSDVATGITLFRRTAEGWTYWGDLGQAPASADWTTATATTPIVPEGTDRIVFGLSLATDGFLETDDYALLDLAGSEEPDPEPEQLVVNPWLVDGDDPGACMQLGGWGEHDSVAGLADAVPADAPEGARSYRIEMADRVSGDLKLIQSEAAGCAPDVAPGDELVASVRYRSDAAAVSVTAFIHGTAGWSYWTELAALPPAAEWTTATVPLPTIPDGADRVSFGVSISSDGVLETTGYGLTALIEPPEQTATPTPTPTADPGEEPTGDPALDGSWEVRTTEMPIRTIHSTLLHDGRILLIAGSGNDGAQFAAGTFRAVVWDPDADTFDEVPVPYDMFCAGHVTLPDGKVLIAGGTEAFPEEDQGPNTFKGSAHSYYFDPEDDAFHVLADMAGAHWYPTLTKLGNGDVWAAGGLDEKASGTVLTEMFDVSEMAWLPAGQVPQTWSFWGTYPHMYLLEDGLLFYAGAHTFGNGLPGTGASLYDWTQAQIWDVPGLREKDMRDQAGSVLLPPAQDQRVMIVGGGNTDGAAPGIDLVDIIDLSEPSPAYEPAADLPGPGKGYVNVINLPDRTVLATSGARYNRADDVLTSAIYDPQGDVWRAVEPDPIGRNYHSSAILMPDGRVAVIGSNPLDNSYEHRLSVYSPPYLHAGTRPTVAGVPDAASHGDVLELDVTGEVVSASLLAPMSSTHQTDTNARLVDLPMAGADGTRTVQVPDNPNLLPPGPYMLTVLDAAGVPSVAEWIWIS